jgi:predicted RNase H-like nuclease (RuvC/YqgF family)
MDNKIIEDLVKRVAELEKDNKQLARKLEDAARDVSKLKLEMEMHKRFHPR